MYKISEFIFTSADRYLLKNYTVMLHRGELLEKAIRESGVPISAVARKIGKSRKHMYNLFENPHVSIDVMLEIGKTIHYDFFNDLEYFRKTESSTLLIAEDEEAYIGSTNYWKDKYLKLLEKYNKLLEDQAKQKKH